VPTGYHADVVVDIAKAGKQVFTEKPIAMTMADVDRMIDACHKAKVILQVGFVRRFDDDWLKFKELVLSGVIGRPVMWRSVSAGHMPVKWFIDEKIGGGPFIDGCIHNFDFGLFTFGKADQAIASLRRFRADTTSLDSGTAIVKYKSGDEIMCAWSWGLPQGCSSKFFHDAIGPAGVLNFASGSQEDGSIEYDISNEKEKNMKVKVEKYNILDSFKRQIEHFIDCVEHKKEPMANGEDGKRVLEVCLAVIESGKTGKPVTIK
jgi:predicted dehydrogenase